MLRMDGAPERCWLDFRASGVGGMKATTEILRVAQNDDVKLRGSYVAPMLGMDGSPERVRVRSWRWDPHAYTASLHS